MNEMRTAETSRERISKGLETAVAGAAMARRRTVAQQSGSVFAAQIAGLACGLLSNFLVAWMLGPVGRGSFYLVQLITTVGQIFLNLGLGPAVIYFLQRDRRYSDSQVRSILLRASFLLGVVPIIVWGLTWPWTASAVAGKLNPLLFWLALGSIPGAVVSLNVSYLSLARGSIASFNILRSAPPILLVALLAVMAARHKSSAAGVAFCWFLTTSITAALAPLIVRMRTDPSESGASGFLRAAVAFGSRSHLGAVTQYLQHRIDAVLVGFLCSLQDVGIFSLGVSIAELLWYLPNTVANVLLSHVAECSDEEGARLTASFCRVTLAITALLAMLLGGISAWVIPVLLPAFSHSLHVLWVLLPGTVSVVIFKILSSDLNGRGKPLETFRPAAISLIASFAGGLIMIPRFGILSAAAVTSTGYILNAALYIRRFSAITAIPMEAILRMRYTDVLMVRDLWRKKRSNKSLVPAIEVDLI